jgi:CubicO group peptidase (beta-lactamase class C family)
MRPFVAAGLLLTLSLGLALPAALGMAQVPAPVQARPGARLAPGAPIPQAELEAFVDGAVRDAMSADHIAGVTVSVVQNGQVALKKGYGFARQAPARPVDPDRTLFRLGPVSHTFAWIVVMKEVEAGHIRLTTPINLYLPEKLQVKDQGFKRPIYVGDLTTHSAGFEDRVLGHLFEDDPDRVRPLALYLRQERPRRVREAGTLSSPSDYGVALGGEAASYVTNKPFETLVEVEITAPWVSPTPPFASPIPPATICPVRCPPRWLAMYPTAIAGTTAVSSAGRSNTPARSRRPKRPPPPPATWPVTC